MEQGLATSSDTSHADVCLCDPFILPGMPPTCGVASLRAILRHAGFSARVLYPSLEFSVENRLFADGPTLRLLGDVPYQLTECLFVENLDPGTVKSIEALALADPEGLGGLSERLDALRRSAGDLLDTTAERVRALEPAVLMYSLTFGDYGFAAQLFSRVKKLDEGIKIVVGGSNCTPDFSRELMAAIPEIDCVVCDDTGTAAAAVAGHFVRGAPLGEDAQYVSMRGDWAVRTRVLESLDAVPCPEFDDYLQAVRALGIDTELVTLSYETSRGCWWGENEPCAMCGFFGEQRMYVSKTSAIVIEDIRQLVTDHGIRRFRFTDLVQPAEGQLSELLPLSELDLSLFWELRPDVGSGAVSQLRSIGVKAAQVGIESLCTAQLERLKKGIRGIDAVQVLRLLTEYKVDATWNYLYGGPDDRAEWFTEVLALMPMLYHLQPPTARRLWVNRHSEDYSHACSSRDLKPVAGRVPQPEFSQAFDVFFESESRTDLGDVYTEFVAGIEQWRSAYAAGSSCFVEHADRHSMRVVDERVGRKVYLLTGLQAHVYERLSTPRSMDQLSVCPGGHVDDLQAALDALIDDALVLKTDGCYIALATGGSRYRWTHPREQAMYIGPGLLR